MPAGILLLTSGATFFFAASDACALSVPDGLGVRGSLRGWAADVDVAGGMVLERRDVVVKKRWGWEMGFRAARRQLRHIILGVVVCSIGGVVLR